MQSSSEALVGKSSGSATFPCDKCPSVFNNQRDLSNHNIKANHTSARVVCAWCVEQKVREFRHPQDLKRHVRDHHTIIYQDFPERALSLENCFFFARNPESFIQTYHKQPNYDSEEAKFAREAITRWATGRVPGITGWREGWRTARSKAANPQKANKRQHGPMFTLKQINMSNQDAVVIFLNTNNEVIKAQIQDAGLRDPAVTTPLIHKMMSLDPSFTPPTGPWRFHPDSTSVKSELATILGIDVKFLTSVWFKTDVPAKVAKTTSQPVTCTSAITTTLTATCTDRTTTTTTSSAVTSTLVNTTTTTTTSQTATRTNTSTTATTTTSSAVTSTNAIPTTTTATTLLTTNTVTTAPVLTTTIFSPKQADYEDDLDSLHTPTPISFGTDSPQSSPDHHSNVSSPRYHIDSPPTLFNSAPTPSYEPTTPIMKQAASASTPSFRPTTTTQNTTAPTPPYQPTTIMNPTPPAPTTSFRLTTTTQNPAAPAHLYEPTTPTQNPAAAPIYRPTPIHITPSVLAKTLLMSGSMPILPPGRREWSAVPEGSISITPTLFWPPNDWTSFTHDQKALAVEFAAMSLELQNNINFKHLDRTTLLFKYNYLVLPGTKLHHTGPTTKMLEYNYEVIKNIAVGKDTSSTENQIAIIRSFSPTPPSTLLQSMKHIPLRLTIEGRPQTSS